MLSSCLVTIKRYDDKLLNDLAKGPEQACWKASGNDDNATAVVGVYEILPTNCMRKALLLLSEENNTSWRHVISAMAYSPIHH
jgi:hypothetical protein